MSSTDSSSLALHRIEGRPGSPSISTSTFGFQHLTDSTEKPRGDGGLLVFGRHGSGEDLRFHPKASFSGILQQEVLLFLHGSMVEDFRPDGNKDMNRMLAVW